MCNAKPRICISPLAAVAIGFGGVLLGVSMVFVGFDAQFGVSYAEFSRYHTECQSAIPHGAECVAGFVVMEADGHP